MRYAEFAGDTGSKIEVTIADGIVRLQDADHPDRVWRVDTAAFINLIAGDLPRLTERRVVVPLEGEEAFYLGTALQFARENHNRVQLSAGAFDGLMARVRRAVETPAAPIILSDFDAANPETLVDATHYSAQVFRLIAHADAEQREVLRTVYPEHVGLWEHWSGNVPQ